MRNAFWSWAVAVPVILGCAFAPVERPRWRAPSSEKQFFNEGEHEPAKSHVNFGKILHGWFTARVDPTLRRVPPDIKPPRRVGVGELRVTFVGHATVLIQVDAINILTDPMWSQRPSPVSWLGPSRMHSPGLRFEDLPPIDVVLLSHDHYDHLDLPTLRRLQATHAPQIYAGLRTPEWLHSKGIAGAIGLDWWDSKALASGLGLTFVPARHGSARVLSRENGRLWGGFVIEGIGGPIYFAGDTGWGGHFSDLRQRFGPMRLALLPIDAFELHQQGNPVHIAPSEAIRAHTVLCAGVSVAIHFGLYPLSERAPAVLKTQLLEAGDPDLSRSFWILDFGEGRNVPVATPANPRPEKHLKMPRDDFGGFGNSPSSPLETKQSSSLRPGAL